MNCAHIVRSNGTAIHELLGHVSGKLLAEPTPGVFNFDHDNPPISPITGKPIQTWYKPKETWNIVFGKLAMTVEERRAFPFAYYLADNKGILALLGYDQYSVPTADDREYPKYLEGFRPGKLSTTRIFMSGWRDSAHSAAPRSTTRPGV